MEIKLNGKMEGAEEARGEHLRLPDHFCGSLLTA
jgi:hypothetical protein